MTLDLKNNLSVILYAVDDIRLEHHDVPPVGDNDALIEMYCVGICGSDVHFWKHGRIGDFILNAPMVLGHEGCGIVRQVGSKVTHLKEGDRVAIEPGIPCFRCEWCIHGKYNLCPDMKFAATPPIHGNLCRYYVQCADFCFKLPDHVSFEEGALLEPLAVGIHANKRGEVTVGKKVLILGAGPIGLVTLITALYSGADSVLITDLNPDRLKVAAKFGAKTLKVEPDLPLDKLVKCVKKCLGESPDVTIDCTGFESTVGLAIKATKSGGIAVVVGMGGSDFPKVPIFDNIIREVEVRGSFRYCNDYRAALSMVASGKIDAKRLITHKFQLEEIEKGLATTLSGEGIKVMIYCQKK